MNPFNCTVFVPFVSQNPYDVMAYLRSIGAKGSATVYYNLRRVGWQVTFKPCEDSNETSLR